MIRLSTPLSLIFFVIMLAGACKQKDKEEITIVWNHTQAAGIAISTSLLKNHQEDSILNSLHVHLKNNPSAMLGSYSIADDKILFKPLIPLSAGMTYEIFFNKDIIGNLEVPLAGAAKATSLLAVYPTQDTLPENLLKIYLRFTAPMREGKALEHIALLDDHNVIVPNVFLNLQPELWNEERTVLTIWLDPGRIKRDLIPNRQMGNPLRRGQQYTLSVSNDWKDIQGLPLRESYTKKFIVAQRDSASPNPELWKLKVPAQATTQPLMVSFGEPLDYFLLGETIQINDAKGNRISGKLKVENEEAGLEFSPDKPWHAGRYRLHIATHLEDLAGNNLMRPFDRDIKTQAARTDTMFEKEFVIRGKR